MSVATVEATRTIVTTAVRPAPARPRPVGSRPAAPARTRPRRPRPPTGPSARPEGAVAAPSLAPARAVRPQACAAIPAQPSRPHAWRLTERGIAVVLVAAAVIATAAVAVVALTAFRVTGDGYRAEGSTGLVQVASP